MSSAKKEAKNNRRKPITNQLSINATSRSGYSYSLDAEVFVVNAMSDEQREERSEEDQ